MLCAVFLFVTKISFSQSHKRHTKKHRTYTEKEGNGRTKQDDGYYNPPVNPSKHPNK